MSEARENELEDVSYSEAVAELEAILEAIDRDAVDLDELGDKVSRAAVLIEHCRERIDATETQVQEVIQGLEGDDSE